MKRSRLFSIALFIVTFLLADVAAATTTTVFFDDFTDGVIDPAVWRSNGRTGGSVTEHNGVMDVDVYDGNDIQYQTIQNLLTPADRLIFETRVQARFVAPDKNAGFFLGNADGSEGIDISFSEKWQRVTSPFGARGSQFGTDPIQVGGGDNADWHVVRIVKEADLYTVTIDDLLVGSGVHVQPTSWHFNGGRHWMSSYGYEAADLYFDYVRVTAETDSIPAPAAAALVLAGLAAIGLRRRL